MIEGGSRNQLGRSGYEDEGVRGDAESPGSRWEKNLYIKFYIKELIILIMYIEFDVQIFKIQIMLLEYI